ncbi:TDP43_N domain-containing protein [Meloidogyne graminicola]|uniref:TDP43_N domain-containing protein n=1 Tax=Meloidogyne graminicola TaxID=189291 RepID=A0A8S9ZSM0_9BILA|nr:TDP43_N domain-containing protein [Meloidogyne graminicola]
MLILHLRLNLLDPIDMDEDGNLIIHSILMSKIVLDLITGSSWWKKLLYYNPVVHPLNKGPDFSFLDGRKPAITTTLELERMKKHVELGKQIVHYLNEIKIAEQLYEEQQMQKTFLRKR